MKIYRYGRGKTLKKTVYTRNGTTYNYKNKFNIHPRFSHYNENYSVGFQGFSDTGYILNQPETTVEITLTPTILTFKIIEKIQVACEFKSMYDENLGIMNNIEVRPEDVARKDLQCSNGSKTETFKMDGNDRILKCSYTTSCSHKIYQTPRTKGFKGRSSSGATVYYDEPGKNLADPYAPWTIAHTQNITINLAKMAKDNGLTQQELAWELICGKLNYIPTNKVNEKDNNDLYNVFELNQENKMVLTHFLWQSHNLGNYFSSLIKRKESEFEKLLAAKDFVNAQETINYLIKLEGNENHLKDYYKVRYAQIKHYINENEISLSEMRAFLNQCNVKEYRDTEAMLYSHLMRVKSDNYVASAVECYNLHSSFSDAMTIYSSTNRDLLAKGKTKVDFYTKKRNEIAKNIVDNASQSTPGEKLDSAYFYYASDSITRNYVKNKCSQYQSNYKSDKKLYFNQKDIWYKVVSSANEVEVTISRDKEYKGNITIPSTVKFKGVTYNVTGVGDWAFARCANLQSIQLPNTIRTIGTQAFDNCTSLTSIKLPKGVEKIGNLCFFNCRRLNSIELPQMITEIPKGCFLNCDLKNTQIPYNVETIADFAFSFNENLEYVYLHGNIKSLGYNSFLKMGNSINKLVFPHTNPLDIPYTQIGRIQNTMICVSDNIELWMSYDIWSQYNFAQIK